MVPGLRLNGEPTEAQVLASVLARLEYAKRQGHVAWYARMNTGAGKLVRRDGSAGQWMRFGFPGCPDILGQMPGGRVMLLEVKAPGGRVRPEQAAFLSLALEHGAAGGIVRSIEDVDNLWANT